MEDWLITYPHKIHASVLVFNGKVVDYKIGQNYWKDLGNVTLRGQISLENLFKSEVRHKFWLVTSEEEHQKIFDITSKKWITEQNNNS